MTQSAMPALSVVPRMARQMPLPPRFDARSAAGPPQLFNALWDTSLRSA
jgi:hypothetical protein